MAIINLRLSIINLPMREFRCLTDICGRVYANLSAAFNMIFFAFSKLFFIGKLSARQFCSGAKSRLFCN